MLTYTFGRPHVGVLLWAWTALLVPNSFFFGFALAFPFNLTVAVATVMCWMLSSERVKVPVTQTFWLLVAMALLACLSTFLAIGDASIAYIEWDKFIKIIIFAIVITGLMNTRSRLHALVFAIVFSLGFHGSLEAMKYLVSGGGHAVTGPINSTMGDNNHFALAMICTLPLVWYLIQETSHRLLRFGLMGVALLLFVAIVGTYSRGAVIGVAAVMFWAFLKSNQKIRFSLVLIPLVCALFVLAPERWFNRIDTISAADNDSSFLGRVVAWKFSTLIAMDRPLLGGGFHAVQNFSVVQHYYPDLRILDFISTPEPDMSYARAAHSIYFQVLGDMGFLGLALFIAMAIVSWRCTAAIVKTTHDKPDLLWARRLAQALQYSLVGYYTAGAALSLAYFELMYIIFAMISVLHVLVKNETVALERQAIANDSIYSRSLPSGG